MKEDSVVDGSIAMSAYVYLDYTKIFNFCAAIDFKTELASLIITSDVNVDGNSKTKSASAMDLLDLYESY